VRRFGQRTMAGAADRLNWRAIRGNVLDSDFTLSRDKQLVGAPGLEPGTSAV
jgi:hypothetical protein